MACSFFSNKLRKVFLPRPQKTSKKPQKWLQIGLLGSWQLIEFSEKEFEEVEFFFKKNPYPQNYLEIEQNYFIAENGSVYANIRTKTTETAL